MLRTGQKPCLAGLRDRGTGQSTSLRQPLPAVRSHWRVFSGRRATARAAAAADAISTPVIVGAGIAGLAAAAALHKVGVPCKVLERSDTLRGEGSAIALWSNAFRALEALAAADGLRSEHLLLERTELVRDTGKLLRGFDFSECNTGSELRGVRRVQLLQTLASQLPEGTIQYGCGVEGVETAKNGRPVLQLSTGERLEAPLVVGADGVNSKVAKHLELPTPNYAGYTAFRGIAHFKEGVPMPSNTVRQIFGEGRRAGMYPISDTDCYWYITFIAHQDAPSSKDPAVLAAEAAAVVKGWSWNISEAVANTAPEGLTRSRIVDRWTYGTIGRGAVTVIGDGMHPMTPNLGQGGCSALEDAVVLGRAVARALRGSTGSDSGDSGAGIEWSEQQVAAVSAALREFERQRSQRCLPLVVKSWAFGFALQNPYAPVCAARDWFIENRFQPAHFLDHTAFDCGKLPQPVTAEATR